jgi:hypothetical protein
MFTSNTECIIIIITLPSQLLLEIGSGIHVSTTVYASLNVCCLTKATVTTHARVLDFH